MVFKRLELIGFKSFCDKTLLSFEPGVTAIVGPNGCGKSNIADAIRWVLGEQSAKSLRGSSMEDVIFNGSNEKEALNIAEVSLVLSNQSRMLPIDYEEVIITRRLYRSGESEYLINKNGVRLKDVQELFMGTGMGTDSYSIIEQGKMDRVLNAKPEERREIFEEAAGITKYKAKKKEALRKLEQTDANLLRVNDIVAEVKRQIGSVERQAKKAENYKIEFEQLKNLEVSLSRREFLEFYEKCKNEGEILSRIQAEAEEFSLGLRGLEAQFQEKKSGVSSLEEALRSAKDRELQITHQSQRAQDRLLLNRERAGELSARKDQLAKEILLTQARVEEIKAESQKIEEDFARRHAHESEGLEFLTSVETNFSELENLLKNSFKDEESIKLKLLSLANEKAHAHTELAKLHAERHALQMRRKRLEDEAAQYLKEDEELRARLEEVLVEARKESQSLNPLLEEKIQAFKAKVRFILSKNSSEAELEAEIRAFVEQVSNIQITHSDKHQKLNLLEEQKKKVLERISLMQMEVSETIAEENLLSDKEKETEPRTGALEIEECRLGQQILEIESQRRVRAKEREALLVKLAEVRAEQNHRSAELQKIEKERERLKNALDHETARTAAFQSELTACDTKKEEIENDDKSLRGEFSRLEWEKTECLRSLEESKNQAARALEALGKIEAERNEKQAYLSGVSERKHALELGVHQLRFEMDRLKERIFNAYGLDLESPALEVNPAEIQDTQEAKAKIQAQKERLQRLGPVNLVAIQEYDEMKQRFDFLTKQQTDLLQAKDDLHKAILKINRTTRELFVESFEKIQRMFSEYFRQLFGGGSAELVLLDESDVLESGIDIVARPPGKRLQGILLLSGGEKALTAIALLFALFKVRPSPFCVLDEIDAPLDESNVDRFCQVLREFVVGSQFILITHNKRTMNLADAMYGITMAETGVTKIVSVRFSEKKEKKETESVKEEAIAQ